MKEFRDNEGRPWLVALTCASAARIKDLVTIEITEEVTQPDGTTKEEKRQVPFNIIDTSAIHKTLEVLRMNYATIAEAVYAVVMQQVADKGLTKEQFLDGLKGDSLDAAAKALELELIDFFPNRLRPLVDLMASQMDAVLTSKFAEAKANLLEAKISGESSGKPQESSVSTPESGHSGSSLQPATAA